MADAVQKHTQATYQFATTTTDGMPKIPIWCGTSRVVYVRRWALPRKKPISHPAKLRYNRQKIIFQSKLYMQTMIEAKKISRWIFSVLYKLDHIEI